MWTVLLFLLCLHHFKPYCIWFHVPTWQIVMHCMQGKHLRMLFAVHSPQKCQAFLRVICGIVEEGWMNFVSKFSLRFDDRAVSSFLHQYERSREGCCAPVWYESSSNGEGGEKKPFGSSSSKAVGNQCRDGSWCVLSWWLKGSSSTLMARLLQKAF